jgi:hypothetical protein
MPAQKVPFRLSHLQAYRPVNRIKLHEECHSLYYLC